jgi:hypothetical protein
MNEEGRRKLPHARFTFPLPTSSFFLLPSCFLESHPERDLRAVRSHVVDEPVVAVIDIEYAIDDFPVDSLRQLATKTGRGLPGEIRADIKRTDVGACR